MTVLCLTFSDLLSRPLQYFTARMFTAILLRLSRAEVGAPTLLSSLTGVFNLVPAIRPDDRTPAPPDFLPFQDRYGPFFFFFPLPDPDNAP